MRALSALFICTVALASTLVSSATIERRAAEDTIDFNGMADKTLEWAKLRPDEGRPWSLYQMSGMIMPSDEAKTIYVDCIKSADDLKGCPIELPWNEKGCFMWIAGGSVSWRKCNKYKSGNAYWDAGSIFKRIYEDEPINNDPARYDGFTKNPIRFEILNRLSHR